MNAVSNSEVEGEVGRILLNAIQVDPVVQQRAAGTSQDVVDDYAEAMRNGVEFPPIDVFSDDDGTFHLADGFHRLKARRLAFPDVEEIECRVHPGNRDDAILFACGANAQHGLQRSRSDKLKAVRTLISSEVWSGWSDREIARQCGVSHTYVAEVRSEHLATLPDAGPQEQEAASETPPADDPSATGASGTRPVRRRTARRGGRRYNMDTARIGRGRSRPTRRSRGTQARIRALPEGAGRGEWTRTPDVCRAVP
jgi:ParB-like nuclease domain